MTTDVCIEKVELHKTRQPIHKLSHKSIVWRPQFPNWDEIPQHFRENTKSVFVFFLYLFDTNIMRDTILQESQTSPNTSIIPIGCKGGVTF